MLERQAPPMWAAFFVPKTIKQTKWRNVYGIFQSGNRHSQNSGHGSWRWSGGMGRHQPSGRLRVGQPCGKKPGH